MAACVVGHCGGRETDCHSRTGWGPSAPDPVGVICPLALSRCGRLLKRESRGRVRVVRRGASGTPVPWQVAKRTALSPTASSVEGLARLPPSWCLRASIPSARSYSAARNPKEPPVLCAALFERVMGVEQRPRVCLHTDGADTMWSSSALAQFRPPRRCQPAPSGAKNAGSLNFSAKLN